MRVRVAWLIVLLAGCATTPRETTEDVAIPASWTPSVERSSSLAAWPEDGPVSLSIEQGVMFALAGNRDLAVRQLDPVISGTFELLEEGEFDPELFAELGYSREKTRETSRSTGEAFDVDARDTDVRAGVRTRLDTGTSLEGAVEQTRSASNRAPEQQVARVGLTVTQQLLRGLDPAVNLARVRQAELGTRASVFELRRFTEVLVAETKIAYWNFVLAKQEIAIFEESLAIARQQLSEIEDRIAVGVLPDTEAAAPRAEVALREQALIESRGELEKMRLRLLSRISLDATGRLDREVEATSAPEIEPEPLTDVEERAALARGRRPDLNEARLRREQNRLEVVATRDGLMPKLELFLSLGATGYGDTVLDSFGSLDGKTWDAEAGLSLSLALGNRSARGRNLEARASRERVARAIENLEQRVTLEVWLAANEVERARQQIGASRTTRRLQELTVEAERQRFEVGTGTGLLVAQAQRDLLAARIAEVRSVVTYRIARILLHLAEGSVLERNGVTLDDPGPVTVRAAR